MIVSIIATKNQVMGLIHDEVGYITNVANKLKKSFQ